MAKRHTDSFSLACSTPTPSGLALEAWNRLFKPLPPKTSTVHLEFDVRLPLQPCTVLFELAKLVGGNQSLGIEVKVDTKGWYLSADLTDGGYLSHYLPNSPAYGAWHHVVLDALLASVGSARLAVDGLSSGAASFDTTGVTPGVLVGLFSQGTCPPEATPGSTTWWWI